MRRMYFIVLVLLLLIIGCNQQPIIDMNEVLIQLEKYLRGTVGVETTASSFDGKSDIKIRLMVEGTQTEEKAEILFNKIIKSIVQFSNHPDVWNYYNGYFDIKSYNNGVIYEATKLIGEDLEIMPAKEYE